MQEKVIIALSDLHCGHKSGLTPKRFQNMGEFDSKIQGIQSLIWDWTVQQFSKIQKIDLLLLNGDMIDGRGEKSGGSELISTDQLEQCDIATHAIKTLSGKRKTKVLMTYGTPYHTGKTEDYERIIASDLDAEIADIQKFYVNGLVFSARHKINKAGLPHTQGNTIAKEWVWNAVKSTMHQDEKADVFIFSHIHDYNVIGNGYFHGFTTPGFEWSTKYGARQVTGKIDIGFIEFHIRSKDDFWYKPHLMNISFRNSTMKII